LHPWCGGGDDPNAAFCCGGEEDTADSDDDGGVKVVIGAAADNDEFGEFVSSACSVNPLLLFLDFGGSRLARIGFLSESEHRCSAERGSETFEVTQFIPKANVLVICGPNSTPTKSIPSTLQH
jgi:hypothetical protein